MFIGVIDPWHAAFVQVTTPKYLPGWDSGSCPNGGGALLVAGGASLEGGRVCGLACCAVTVIANRRIAIGVVRRIARHLIAPWPTSHRQFNPTAFRMEIVFSSFQRVTCGPIEEGELVQICAPSGRRAFKTVCSSGEPRRAGQPGSHPRFFTSNE